MESNKLFAEGISWKKVFWIFVIGCIFGCIMETCLHFLKYGDIVSRRGLIYGPLNPVYGLGAAIFTIFLCKRKNIFVIFLLAAILGGGLEYLCSYIQEYLFGTISWDYSKHPFNIHGRTSLKYMLYWGILGVLFAKVIYPFLSNKIEKMPVNFGNAITVFMMIFIIIDCIVSIAASYRQWQRNEGIEPSNKIEMFFDEKYPDERLDQIYENKRDA